MFTRRNRNVLDELLALGGQLEGCDYLVNSIDMYNGLDFIIYVHGQSQRDKECLNSSLKQAIANSRTDAIRFFIEKDADANTATYKGETALYQAIVTKNTSLVNFLLQHNADINIATNKGQTLLHAAVVVGNVEITRLLILRGADVNVECPCFLYQLL